MNEPFSCESISVGSSDMINNTAFDGCAYYCTIKCKCEIVMFNRCYQEQKRFCTRREYDCICYDWCARCFWASSETCHNKIFKLDCNMNEIDCISIYGLTFSSKITGISSKFCNDTLIVSFACAIVEVEKCSESSSVLYCCKNGWILGVLSLCPCTLAIILKDDQYYVKVFDVCWETIKSYCVKDKVTLKNLMFNPCKCARNPFGIDVFLLKKHSYPYIFSCDVCFEELGFVPHSCNYEICEIGCCESNCIPQDACSDVLESIALVETALSHILNAEGEKIQKALEETDDLEKILCVNREVNKTIVNATHLEHVLYSKLSALQECGVCDNPCKKEDSCRNCDDHNQCNTDCGAH